MSRFAALALLVLATASPAFAAGSTAPDDPELAQVFDHLAFLQGAWTGEGLGGQTDETWLPPRAGQMMGLFRLVVDGAPRFSEILTVGRFDGRIELRLKHFDEQLHGWEERTDVVSFPFEVSEPGRVAFRGLVFQRDGDDGLRIELRLRSGGETRTEVFTFRRL